MNQTAVRGSRLTRMRLYHLLLRLLPSSFREEYADELTGVFARQHAQTTGIWQEPLEDEPSEQARGFRTRTNLLQLRSSALHDATKGDPGRTSRFAGATDQAKIDVL